jgi:hypothetical protein
MRIRSTSRGPVSRFRMVGLTLLAVALASSARAQIVIDYNLLWNNSATATLAGQFNGTAGAGAPACGAGFTAASIGTSQYTQNVLADPQIPAASTGQVNSITPNWRPAATSPAFTANGAETGRLPDNGFFQSACYLGALPPAPAVDWTQGWTYYDSLGTGRTDLHYDGNVYTRPSNPAVVVLDATPAMPNPRPAVVLENHNLYSPRTLSNDSNYVIVGQLRVKSQSSLTIEPGTVIFQDFGSIGTIVIERGGKLFADGTAAAPIIVTTNRKPGTMVRGSIGGIVMNGYARTNRVNSCLGDSVASEGGAVGFYGGNNDDDDSGVLRYVRVEYAGREVSANNELNSFTWNSVGRRTTLQYLQAHQGVDDMFEFFGGTANLRYAVGTDGSDDGVDWQLGWRGNAQFVVVRLQSTDYNPAAGQNPDKAIEADNNEFAQDELQCAGRSLGQVANATFIGDRRAGPGYGGVSSGVNLRRGTAGLVMNSIITNFKVAAFRIENDPTFQAHCTVYAPAGVFDPPLACNGVVGVPDNQGRVFVTHGAPNPFTRRVGIGFTLATAGPVQVEIFGANGSRVATLAEQHLPAGWHRLTWEAGPSVPTGVYFYRVLAGQQQATGTIVRVD